LLELRSTLQPRWRAPTPVLATPIAKSSWLPVTRQDLRGWQPTSTSMTSPQTSCLLWLPRTRPVPAGTLDVSATEDGTNGAGVSGTAYPSATLRRPSSKSRVGYTPPLSNASCRSQRSHAKLRGYAPEKSSPSSGDTRQRSHHQPRGLQEGGRRRQSWRSRPREQPHLQSLTAGRLRRPPED
jgi:hypothetical protein